MGTKRFKLPERSPAKLVDIRELTGAHELEAAQMADSLAGEKSASALIAAEQREAVRLSVVRIDDRQVDHAVPLFEIDEWPRRSREALARFFGAVNGIPGAEIKRLIKGAELLSDGAGRHGKRFRLPADCPIETVEIWEIGAIEELAAARAVDAAGALGPISSTLLNRRALVAASMRSQPVDWDNWTLRTGTALSMFFEDVNGIPEEEISGLVAAAVDVGAAAAGTSSPPAAGGASATG